MKTNRFRFLNKWLLGLLMLVLCSCARVNTRIELRPELTTDDTEVWEVYGGGNKFASYEDVRNAVKYEAAKQSEAERKDCFVMLTREDQRLYFSETITSAATMHGSSSYHSNHYSSYGTHYGSSQGSASYSYQVPVSETINYSKETTSWYVLFHDYDDCEELERTKWRGRVWSNTEIIEETEFRSRRNMIIGGGLILIVIIASVLGDTNN
jgi:hypothetical protein